MGHLPHLRSLRASVGTNSPQPNVGSPVGLSGATRLGSSNPHWGALLTGEIRQRLHQLHGSARGFLSSLRRWGRLA